MEQERAINWTGKKKQKTSVLVRQKPTWNRVRGFQSIRGVSEITCNISNRIQPNCLLQNVETSHRFYFSRLGKFFSTLFFGKDGFWNRTSLVNKKGCSLSILLLSRQMYSAQIRICLHMSPHTVLECQRRKKLHNNVFFDRSSRGFWS